VIQKFEAMAEFRALFCAAAAMTLSFAAVAADADKAGLPGTEPPKAAVTQPKAADSAKVPSAGEKTTATAPAALKAGETAAPPAPGTASAKSTETTAADPKPAEAAVLPAVAAPAAAKPAEPDAAQASGTSPEDIDRFLGRDKAGQDAGSSGWMAGMKSVFWLGVVVVLIAGLAFVVRRYLPGTTRTFKSPAMQVLGRTLLDSKKALYLVKVGDRVLVLGTSQEGLRTLSEISDPREVQDLMQMAQSGTKLPFAALLAPKTAPGGAAPAAGAPPVAARSAAASGGAISAIRAEEEAYPALRSLNEEVSKVRQQVEQLRKLG
jgi:flagellar protein FliO/FliZ